MGYYNDEYGIAKDDDPSELHRGPMSLAEAQEWLDEWYVICDEDGKGAAKDMFVIIQREVGPWEPYA